MSIPQIYFLNGPDLASSTAVYYDAAMTLCAADGFYSDGVITRQQVGCTLLPAQPCPTCGVECGGLIDISGSRGIYLVNINLGGGSGAVRIKFNPFTIPDGIKVLYDAIIYNKLSSYDLGQVGITDPLILQGDPNLPTYIGDLATACVGLCGGTFPNLTEYEYNGTSFVPTGNIVNESVLAGQCDLSAANPGECTMVIHKANALPATMQIRISSVCASTAFTLKVECPAELDDFMATDVGPEPAFVCLQPKTFTYYICKSTPSAAYLGSVHPGDWVYYDSLGASPLVDGWYAYYDTIEGRDQVFRVSQGIVVEMQIC